MGDAFAAAALVVPDGVCACVAGEDEGWGRDGDPGAVATAADVVEVDLSAVVKKESPPGSPGGSLSGSPQRDGGSRAGSPGGSASPSGSPNGGSSGSPTGSPAGRGDPAASRSPSPGPAEGSPRPPPTSSPAHATRTRTRHDAVDGVVELADDKEAAQGADR